MQGVVSLEGSACAVVGVWHAAMPMPAMHQTQTASRSLQSFSGRENSSGEVRRRQGGRRSRGQYMGKAVVLGCFCAARHARPVLHPIPAHAATVTLLTHPYPSRPSSESHLSTPHQHGSCLVCLSITSTLSHCLPPPHCHTLSPPAPSPCPCLPSSSPLHSHVLPVSMSLPLSL